MQRKHGILPLSLILASALLLPFLSLPLPAQEGQEQQEPADEQREAPAVAKPAMPSADADLEDLVDPEFSAKEGRDIVELYDDAVASTKRVTEDYRRIRAMQLAQMRDMPFQEAYDNIQSVMPELDPINRELLRRGIRNPDDIVPHKTEIEHVKKEVEEMIELVKRLLLEIERIQAQMAQHMQVPEVELEDVLAREQFDPDEEPEPQQQMPEQAEEMAQSRQEQQDLMQELEEQAREDEDQQAKDLAPLMRRVTDVKDLTQEQQDTDRMSQFDLFQADNDLSKLNSLRRDAENVLLARKIEEGGEPREWLFLDTWYTIGPFPNPGRANLNRQFPPETIVDLDATYPGKGGREIGWEWVQSRDVFVIPANAEEYGIWYAYTEFYVDRPMDLWVAVGSDDKANVWLNGLPIWISGDQLKGWRINEGFRKVHFEPGVNRILFRIENGWMSVAFSMAIRAGE